MSETITLGKSRKDGQWKVLVQPEKPFGEHLLAYRAIASKHPVSDDYSRVVIGKIHHSSPALTLVSSEQAVANKKAESDRQQSVVEIVRSADSRAVKLQKDADKIKAEEHAEAIGEKNTIIDNIRRDTNQPTAEAVKKSEAEAAKKK